MILKIFCDSEVYVYKDIDRTFCITKSYGGMISLQFDVSIKHSLYKYLREEVRLEYDGQYYLIKGVNERTTAGVCTINAELDLTGLESKIYLNKKWTTVSFRVFVQDILSDTGWTIVNAEMVSKRTTTEAQDQTPLQLLEQATNLTSYGACYEFDTKNRRITCIKPENNTTPTGCYFTDELNLKDLTFKGSSSGLVTRLYPVGKDGLTIATVNNGKQYIDNNTYSDKVIAKVWRDERYTNAQSLYDDAVVKLAAMANPERSYSCKVIDLAKMYPDLYENILGYELYDVVTQIDRIRGTRVDHRIVETKEYPADRSLNTVTFSLIAGRVTGKLKALDNRLIELDAQQLHDRTKVNEIKQDLDTTVLHISESWASSVNESMFTQTAEGLFLEVDKMIGTDRWGTLIQQSASDIRIAWNNISKYIQFESGELRIYDSAQTNQKLRTVFNDSGNHFYRDNYYVGKIGTNQWDDNTSHKGLVFDLDWQGKYMAFAQKESSNANTYTTMLCFSRKNSIYNEYGMHLGCDLYGHYKKIHNVHLDGVKVTYNSVDYQAFTGTIYVLTDITDIYEDSEGKHHWSFDFRNIKVSNGLIVG